MESEPTKSEVSKWIRLPVWRPCRWLVAQADHATNLPGIFLALSHVLFAEIIVLF